ncbi:MAG: dihydrolipoamide acetyltransferase family protein [SAR202 cluster bacterium]|jgi:2-oxoisovalerate dehydrogenase E2 component (dihydrolipoyl transacylase)|nr:dihydrolipoamide acetyltransferase family protein [SAR202 cluster bacterium]MDP6713518.1 dihydrolipoamide acetyltransferase family protein [SAR202 cluster bacterium]
MKIELPQVGESVTEGVIGKWLKQIGDRVEKFDPLVEVVTDKVNMEMPSPVTGTLTSIIATEGETVPMGGLIAEIEIEGEEPASVATAPADEPQPSVVNRTGELLKDVAPVGPTGGVLHMESDTPAPSGRKRYSPAVLRLADEHDIDLSRIEGTGMNGRITRKDVQQAIDQGIAAPGPAPVAPQTPTAPSAPGTDEERVPLTPIRRLIAENMVKSATLIPQAWTTVEVDVSGLIQRRQAVRTEFQEREGINITYLPFVIKALAESLKENPLLNSSWGGDSIILKKRINIGVAMATSEGLMVPVIHDADTLSIAGLAKRVRDLTERARQGKLRLEDVQGGTFTANNTGVLGSVESKPLVNYPQAAIMTTEAIVKRPVVINDAIAIRSMMNLCMSFDHRIMDGAEASGFINAVKARLEAIDADTGVY